MSKRRPGRPRGGRHSEDVRKYWREEKKKRMLQSQAEKARRGLSVEGKRQAGKRIPQSLKALDTDLFKKPRRRR